MKFDDRLRKATYLSGTLGMLALGVAEMNFVYLGLISVVAIVAWARDKHHTGRPLGAAMLNVVVLLAMGYAAIDYFFISQGWILSLAHFLLVVQMAKLLLPKTDRDYAQIYLISLMNVAVGAIVTVNVFYAVTFVLYSGTAVWGLILFHFHREVGAAPNVYLPTGSDTVRPTPSADVQAVVSKRFLWTLVAVIFLTWICNGTFFLFSPRMPQGFVHLNPMGFLSRLTGYSDTVTLGEMGEILQNSTPVMHVRMRTSDGKRVTGERSFYWRGATYQFYDGRRWRRFAPDTDFRHVIKRRIVPFQSVRRTTLDRLPWIEQQITLEPIGTRTLFALPGAAAFKCAGLRLVHENIQDDTILAPRTPRAFTKYTVISGATGGRRAIPRPLRRIYSRHEKPRFLQAYRQIPEAVPARVKDLARTIAPLDRHPTPFEQARRIEAYLSENYAYTLNLDADPGFEPVDDFLFNRRKGHCEYFASSMVMLLRALDIPSRLVSGFHGAEWSDVGQWHVVKQSDAHAWVEAWFEDYGWLTFDPTPGAARSELAGASALGPIDRWLDYLRTTWINHVIEYDEDQQSAILDRTRRASRGIRDAITGILVSVGEFFKLTFSVLTDVQRLATIEGVLTIIGILAASATIVLTMRWLLLKMVRRIREGLARARAQRAGRAHVAFYQELQRVLKRRGFVRPPGATPREFAEDVSTRMHDARTALTELTNAFYRVRFGGEQLKPDEEQRLRAVIESLRSAGVSRPR